MAWRSTTAEPTVCTTTSGPPGPHSARTRSGASSPPRTTWCAPRRSASSSLASLRLTAITVQPKCAASCTAFEPIPPTPKTTTVSPACTLAIRTSP